MWKCCVMEFEGEDQWCIFYEKEDGDRVAVRPVDDRSIGEAICMLLNGDIIL